MRRVSKRVPCTVEIVGLHNDFVGRIVPGVIATCSRCCHQTESVGTTVVSVRECLSLMREECPCGGSNEYEVVEVRSPHFTTGIQANPCASPSPTS
jgi:hypothetical protein